MRSAAKRSPPPPAKRKFRRRGKQTHVLVAPKFEVLDDGAHSVTIPVFTRPFSNGSQGTTRIGGIMRAREKKRQRDTFAPYLFGIGVSFRSVTMIRMAPSSGLDT